MTPFPPTCGMEQKITKHHTCVNLVCVSPSCCFFFVWKTTTTRGGVFQTQAPSEIPQEAAEPWVGGAQSNSWQKLDDG